MGLLDFLVNMLLDSGKAPALNKMVDSQSRELGRQVERRERDINNRLSDTSSEALRKAQSKIDNQAIKNKIVSELNRRGE